jgi:alkyl hydroperoxide reductase subunit AhpC
MPEFEKRGVKVVGLSVDPVDIHHQWAKASLLIPEMLLLRCC